MTMTKRELCSKLEEYPNDSPVYFRVGRVSYPIALVKPEEIGGMKIVTLAHEELEVKK